MHDQLSPQRAEVRTDSMHRACAAMLIAKSSVRRTFHATPVQQRICRCADPGRMQTVSASAAQAARCGHPVASHWVSRPVTSRRPSHQSRSRVPSLAKWPAAAATGRRWQRCWVAPLRRGGAAARAPQSNDGNAPRVSAVSRFCYQDIKDCQGGRCDVRADVGCCGCGARQARQLAEVV